MKLENNIKYTKTDQKRWYDDACGTAFALEMIGERWAILILRELMFGPRRFSELRRDLNGISANILTLRLHALEKHRILRRRKLPPPASVQVFELTDWGYEAEPLIQMLGKWATRHPDHDPTLPLSAASLMMSFKTMLDPGRAAGLDTRIGFHLGENLFVAHIHAGQIDILREAPVEQAVTFTAAPTVMAAAVYGGVPLPGLEANGLMEIKGNRTMAERFITLFRLPDKLVSPD